MTQLDFISLSFRDGCRRKWSKDRHKEQKSFEAGKTGLVATGFLERSWERKDLPSYYPDFCEPSIAFKTLLDYLANVFLIIWNVPLRNYRIRKPEREHFHCVRHCALTINPPSNPVIIVLTLQMSPRAGHGARM